MSWVISHYLQMQISVSFYEELGLSVWRYAFICRITRKKKNNRRFTQCLKKWANISFDCTWTSNLKYRLPKLWKAFFVQFQWRLIYFLALTFLKNFRRSTNFFKSITTGKKQKITYIRQNSRLHWRNNINKAFRFT